MNNRRHLFIDIYSSLCITGFFVLLCMVLLKTASCEALALDYLTPEMYGAAGNGVVNDTVAFEEMICAMEEERLPALLTKCYLVDSVTLPRGCILRAQGGILKKTPKNEERYSLLVLQDHCTVDGLTLIGDRDNNTTNAEWGHCISMNGSNCSVMNCKIESAHGDGIYVKGNNARISNCLIENAYRNGISITNGQNFVVENSVIKDVHGTAPQYGIVIEPNTEKDHVSGIISNVSIADCHGGVSIHLNNRQVNQAVVQCYNTTIERTIDRRSVSITCSNYNDDEFFFDNIKIIDPDPSSEYLAKFTFKGPDNPKLFFDCLVVGGKTQNGVEIQTTKSTCSNPIDVYLVSEGWTSDSPGDGNDLIIDTNNKNINIHTNLDVTAKKGTVSVFDRVVRAFTNPSAINW